MNGIDRLTATSPLAALDSGVSRDPRGVAADAIGEIGHRVLAWVGASAGTNAGSAAWADASGRDSAFRADPVVLAQRGDVYGLTQMAGDIAGRLGATPTQEGSLRRALEDFTRQAVVQVAGLSGASGERQVAGLGDALTVASAGDTGLGVDAIVARIEAATATLARQNGA